MNLNLDVNTLLGAAVLALSCWTLYTLHDIAKQMTAGEEKTKAQDEKLAEDRCRIIQVEDDVARLQVDVARLETKR